MVGRHQTSNDISDNSTEKRVGNRQKTSDTDKSQANDVQQLAEEEARQIVAHAYEEASRIIADAQQNSKHTDKVSNGYIDSFARLNNLIKSGRITEDSYKQIDALLVHIRRRLEQIRISDQVIADELMNLFLQLEYWVESLAVDSLKLQSLERWLKGTMELAKDLRAKLD